MKLIKMEGNTYLAADKIESISLSAGAIETGDVQDGTYKLTEYHYITVRCISGRVHTYKKLNFKDNTISDANSVLHQFIKELRKEAI